MPSLPPEQFRAWTRSLGVPEDAEATEAIYAVQSGTPQAKEGWPLGVVTFIGTPAATIPKSRRHPFIRQDDQLLEVYWAEVVLPSKRAWATCSWEPRISRIELLPGKWKPDDVQKTAAALRWLENLSTHGLSDEEALEEAVELGREWREENPDTVTRDFGRKQLAEAKCIGLDSLGTWMKRKHFNMRKVWQRLDES